MKRKLLFAMLCIVSALGLRAQTNLLAGWDGGDDTSSPSNFGWTSSANRTFNERNAGSGIRMMTSYSGYKDESGNNYTYSASSDPSSVIFWVRYNTSGESFTYTFKGLEAYHYYKFSGLVGWNSNSSAPTCTVVLNDGTNTLATMSKTASTAKTLYAISSEFQAPSTMTSTTDVKLVFTTNKTGDCIEAISALKLVENYAAYEADLSNYIAYATQLNTKLSNSDLATALSTARTIAEDGEDNATFNDVANLKSAISAAISAYSLNPAGDDVSSLYLLNSGFDIDINFSSSSSTATAANTVYPTFGWESTVPGNCTGATMGYGYSGSINGGNATAPTQNADDTTTGGALVICVGWSGTVTYKSLANIFPAGSYRITYRAYNGNTKNTSAIEAIPLVGFVPTSGDSQINSATETFANQAWSTHTYDFELASNTEGQIQIGLQPTSNTNSYNAPELFIDEVKLEYFDPLKLAQIQWQEAHDALAALDATALPDAAENAITTELAKSVPATTVDDVNNAKAALQALIDSYDGIKAAYDKAVALITLATAEKNNSTGEKTTFETAINTAETNIETRTVADDLTSDYNTLETARQTYVTGGAQPAADHVFDYTFKITDAAVTGTGWSASGTASGQQYTGAPDNRYFDCGWNSTLNKNQTVESLPAGSYTLKAATRGATSEVTSANIYVNQDATDFNRSTDTHLNGNTGGTLGNGWSWTEVNFELRAAGSVTVGFYGQTTGQGWAGADDFHLYYKGSKPMLVEVLNETITEANTLYNNGANVGTGVFQISTAAGTAFSGAISTAQDVYDNGSATPSEVQTAIGDLNLAKTTYEATTLNGPASGVQYRIKSTAADAAGWKNKYYVLKKNPSQAHGGYSTQAEVETTDAFYATAWEFVAVSGNQYKLRMTDADGAVRYLCTNLKGYDEGSTTQIRTTTDADKALVVKVIAATGTDGRWFLQNTEDNSYLGGQDAGLYSNSQNYDLAIEAADKASVEVNITSGKYGTRIFPFKPTAIEGLKYYTCDGVTGAQLNLTEVTNAEDLAANTPYIVEATKDVEVTLQGYGTASAETYTVDPLTGIYTAQTITAGNYVLQTQKQGDVDVQAFYKLEYDATANTVNRAYLTIDSSVKAFFFDNETAITEITEKTESTEVIYNLAGQRVKKAQKGLYIINGKTVLVK